MDTLAITVILTLIRIRPRNLNHTRCRSHILPRLDRSRFRRGNRLSSNSSFRRSHQLHARFWLLILRPEVGLDRRVGRCHRIMGRGRNQGRYHRAPLMIVSSGRRMCPKLRYLVRFSLMAVRDGETDLDLFSREPDATSWCDFAGWDQ